MTAPSLEVDLALPGLVSKPGTSAPGTSVPVLRKFVVAGMVVGSFALGTVSVSTGAEALAIEPGSGSARTLPSTPALAAADVEVRTVSATLRLIRARAVLNWGEIGNALGVSRRTVHNWLTEAPIAPTHLSRLLALGDLVEATDNGDPATTRLRLTQRGRHPRSLLEDFRLASLPARIVPLSTLSVADALAPQLAVPESAMGEGGTRRSTLTGGEIASRRPGTR